VREGRLNEGCSPHQGRDGRGVFLPQTPCPLCPRIVEEVRSILYNQEQEQELLRKHLSKSLSSRSTSSLDTHGIATQQDLLSALINREKVWFSSPTQSVLTLLRSPAQLQAHLSRFLSFPKWVNTLKFHPLQLSPPKLG
jgi:hypothetical protein